MKGKPITNANELAAYAVKVFNAAGFVAWRQNNGAVYDERAGTYRRNAAKLNGVPDVIGFRLSDGKMLGCEVKAGKDKVREEQDKLLLALSQSGGIALVVRHAMDLAPFIANPLHIPVYTSQA